MLLAGCLSFVSFGLQLLNGEATDMEMPGKSNSEDATQGASFSGGEMLMGTLSDPFHEVIHKLCISGHH